MPVDFLTTEQELNYGRYVAEPNDVQLARYFHLDERDLAFINQRRGRHNRLGIALQLTTARFLGTFLTDLTRVLPGVQQFVAVQLNIRRPEVLTRYAERVTTLREHTALIKEYYGYHEFGDFPWSFRLKRLLYTRAWLSNERPALCLILPPRGCFRIRSCCPEQPHLYVSSVKYANGQISGCGRNWPRCRTAGRPPA